MTSTDELDRIWRDGLTAAAKELVITGDPGPRVATRVRQRRRVRRAATAAGVVVLTGSVLIAIIQIGRHEQPAGIATRPAATIAAVVQVDDALGGQLTIALPGHVTTGSPPAVALPSGLIRFEVRGTPGHSLVIDGASGFDIAFTPTGETTVSQDVELPPGDYLMHCVLPGHTEAGEQVVLRISAQRG